MINRGGRIGEGLLACASPMFLSRHRGHDATCTARNVSPSMRPDASRYQGGFGTHTLEASRCVAAMMILVAALKPRHRTSSISWPPETEQLCTARRRHPCYQPLPNSKKSCMPPLHSLAQV